MSNTKNTIEVSVLIPNHNYGKYIERCIRSVVESDFDNDKLEIVIVDDASTDNSLEVIQKVKNASTVNLKVIKKDKNTGLAKTRNEAIAHAHGNYLFFLDSDNYIRKDCLVKHFEFLSQNTDYSSCYAPIQRFEDISGEKVGLLSAGVYDYHELCKGNYIDAMAMFKRKDLIEVGVYDEKMPYGGLEDYELWLRMGIKNKKVHFIDGDPLSYYRVHMDSMINTLSLEKQAEVISYIKNKHNITGMVTVNGQKDTAAATSNIYHNSIFQPLHDIKVQIFWSDDTYNFSEENSQFQYCHLDKYSKNIFFKIGLPIENLKYIRFDICDKLCILNIHDITIQSSEGDMIWRWNPNEIIFKNDIVFIESDEFFPGKTVQLSLNNDPFFIITLLNPYLIKSKELIVNLHLSSISENQREAIGQKSNFPLSFINTSIVSSLNKELYDTKLEQEKLIQAIQALNDKISNLQNENSRASNTIEINTSVINQLIVDKSDLMEEVNNKFENIRKIELEKETLHHQKKELEKLNADLTTTICLKEKELLQENDKILNLAEEKNSLLEKKAELENLNLNLTKSTVLLEKDLSYNKQQLQTLTESIKKLGLEKVELEKKISHIIHQNSELISTNANQNNFISGIEKDRENLIHQKEDLLHKLYTQKEELRTLTEIKADYEDRNQKLLRNLHEMEKRVEILVQQYEKRGIVGIAINRMLKSNKQS